MKFIYFASFSFINGLLFTPYTILAHHPHVIVQENVYVTPSPYQTNIIVAPSQPPVDLAEQVSISPYPDGAWVPGFWSWNGQWVWVKGYWGRPPYPGAAWRPGHWSYHSDHRGWTWKEGHWH